MTTDVVTDKMATSIQRAANAISEGTAKRIDGDGFKAYKVGEIIRVDIKTEED